MPPRRYLVPYKENRSAARNDRTKQEGKVLMTADRVRVCTVIPGTARPSTLLEKMSGSVFCWLPVVSVFSLPFSQSIDFHEHSGEAEILAVNSLLLSRMCSSRPAFVEALDCYFDLRPSVIAAHLKRAIERARFHRSTGYRAYNEPKNRPAVIIFWVLPSTSDCRRKLGGKSRKGRGNITIKLNGLFIL